MNIITVLDDPVILLPFKDILLRTLLLDDPVTWLLLEHLLSTFTSCPAAVGTLFTIDILPRLILLLLEHYLLSTFVSVV